jgi:hypothetical protein
MDRRFIRWTRTVRQTLPIGQKYGVNVVGGCCGTLRPLKKLVESVNNIPTQEPSEFVQGWVLPCRFFHERKTAAVLIGERLNSKAAAISTGAHGGRLPFP